VLGLDAAKSDKKAKSAKKEGKKNEENVW